MRFCVLGSGSKGNATYIQSGNTAILIDGGFSALQIKKRLHDVGVDYTTLNAILITHEHNDHIRGIPVLSRQANIPVFANPATYSAAGDRLANLAAFNEFETGSPFTIQDLTIHPFSVSHDTADPVGFTVSDDTLSLGYCTDTGTVSRLMAHRLSGCHGLVLESNHDPKMLMESHYPLFLKQRIRSKQGHLANHDAASFLKYLLHDDLEQVVLAHLSDSNNDPRIAYRTATSAINGQAPGPRISVAPQDHPGSMHLLGKNP